MLAGLQSEAPKWEDIIFISSKNTDTGKEDMGFAVFLSVVCCLFLHIPDVESIRPFWQFTTTAKPTLPQKYYDKFQNIPPKNETADKLIEYFLGIPLANRGKRQQSQTKLEDTVVVLDASGSVGNCEFKKGKMALKNLMKIDRGQAFSNKYAGVVYSDKATIKFAFLAAKQAANKMDSIPYESGKTNTADGLAKARDLFQDRNAGGQWYPDRRMVFLVTDGQSNVDKSLTITNAQVLKGKRIEIFVVGIGKIINGIKEMVRVASDPPEIYLFRVKTVGDFLKVVKLAIKKVDPDTYKVVGKLPPTCK